MDHTTSLDDGLTEGKLHEMQPLSQRKLFLKITLWATVGLGFVMLIANAVLYSSIESYESGDFSAIGKIESYAFLVVGVAIIFAISFILAAIAVPVWFYRAHDNLKILKKKLSFTSGWAAGWFFVPIANLFYPAKVMKEIHNGTNVAYDTVNRKLSLMPMAGIITLWWATYIISGIFTRISNSMVDENSIGGYGNNYSMSLVMLTISTILTLVSAIALNKLVNEITQKQEELRTGERIFIPISQREQA
ncbi:MAG: hypothetical protein COA32_02865 [Fluviicola sp.]|nr:MAG: hypothetical protein COA32_02865 [Fluviicola sp.]